MFIAAGLAHDFIARLEEATDAMLASLDERAQSRGKRSGATRGLKVKLSEGRKIVAVLDAFVRTALEDDAALLASWNAVKRVHKVGRPAGSSADGIALVENRNDPLGESGVRLHTRVAGATSMLASAASFH